MGLNKYVCHISLGFDHIIYKMVLSSSDDLSKKGLTEKCFRSGRMIHYFPRKKYDTSAVKRVIKENESTGSSKRKIESA